MVFDAVVSSITTPVSSNSIDVEVEALLLQYVLPSQSKFFLMVT